MFNIDYIGLLFVYLLVALPFGPIFGLIGFLLKVRFFGKLKHKYILEEFHLDLKILKWIIIFVVELGLAILVIAGGGTLLSENKLDTFFIIFFPSEVVILGILILIFNKMFPKPKLIPNFEPLQRN
jgi:hypothetical protein